MDSHLDRARRWIYASTAELDAALAANAGYVLDRMADDTQRIGSRLPRLEQPCEKARRLTQVPRMDCR